MWHICHVQNILLKCSAKYFAGMRCVTSPEVWHHTWQNILLQYEQGPVFGFRPNVFDFLISVMCSLVGPILTNRVATAGVLLEPDRKKNPSIVLDASLDLLHPNFSAKAIASTFFSHLITCAEFSPLVKHICIPHKSTPLSLRSTCTLSSSDTPKSAVQSCLHHSTSV